MVAARQRTRTRRDGVTLATLAGFAEDGSPVLVVAGLAEPVVARTTLQLDGSDQGRELVVAFADGDPSLPIVLGRITASSDAPSAVTHDGQRLEIRAEQEIALTCGKATLVLTRGGKVLIRGTHLVSRSSGANLIRGSSVQLN